MNEPLIEKMLVISTGHIKEEDMNLLDNEYSQKYFENTVMQHPGGYGSLLHVGNIKEPYKYEDPFSNEFCTIIDWAIQLGCIWVMFDCDGETYNNLPFFEW